MKWKMRKIVPLLLLVFLLAGCTMDSYSVVGCVITNRSTRITMDYVSFNGTRTFKAHVPDDRPMRVEVTSKSGELQMEIGQKDQEPIYTGRFTEDFSFTLNAPAGDYIISLRASNHSGGVHIDWEK